MSVGRTTSSGASSRPMVAPVISATIAGCVPRAQRRLGVDADAGVEEAEHGHGLPAVDLPHQFAAEHPHPLVSRVEAFVTPVLQLQVRLFTARAAQLAVAEHCGRSAHPTPAHPARLTRSLCAGSRRPVREDARESGVPLPGRRAQAGPGRTGRRTKRMEPPSGRCHRA
ncbi:MAG: hypothetical protein MZU95_14690 [Desulfomicrobium escambiense]|nr:hypothetical protein [Desulfomicrobium escambiense]